MTTPDEHGTEAVVAQLREWLRANLPSDWRAAVEAGDTAALGAITSDPARTSAWYETLGAAGWATPGWPTEHGGRGATADEAGAVADELARWSAGRPDADFVGLALAGATILAWGTEEQRQRYLPPLARGRERWCQLFSEPGAGSDLASLATRAEAHPDGSWVVNGQKVWSSYAHESRFGLLMARSDASLPKHRGITYFLLDMSTPGVQARPLRQMTGDAEFNEVFLDDVVVPDSARLGGVNEGWRVAITTLMSERSGLSGRPAVGPGVTDALVARARTTGAWDSPVLRDRILGLLVEERTLQMATLRAFAPAMTRRARRDRSASWCTRS
ncbi:MAG: acyl-CoA dehydrogenase [Pseudonocardiaceae bacterium]|nr:acyl-CoA dehydrogenase [Pseudonocardiaceae bacterium]